MPGAFDMLRQHTALGAFALLTACAPAGVPSQIHPLEDRVVAVGEELVIVVSASDDDGDHLSYSFSSDVPDIDSRARMSRLPRGAGEFRWTPLAGDVGEWFFDFHVSDGVHVVTATIKVDVRSAVGANAAPKFMRPQGMGTTLNLDSKSCLTLNVEVDDFDSPSVEIAQEAPAIAGADLLKTGDLESVWTWCPSAQQADADDRYTLKLSADDGEHPKTLLPYLIVLRRAQKPDCPGAPPAIAHAPADASTLVGLGIEAEISDDQGLKREPLLYYSTTEPSEPLELGPEGPFTQLTMRLVEGDVKDGTWAADIPNPVAEEAPGTSRDVWYVIAAKDDDDATGGCDHLSESQVYRMTVTNPGGAGGAGLCEACTTDVQCGGAEDLCVRVGTSAASFCLRGCSGAGDCPADYVCSESSVVSVDGSSARQCVPSSNSCSNPAGATCEDDAFEDNDAQSEAALGPVLEPGSHQAVSCPDASGVEDDEDWYEISVVEGTVDLTLSGGDQSDLDLSLYDSVGLEVGASLSFSSDESISRCLPAGVYAVRVTGYGGQENPYSLTYQHSPGSCEQAICQPDENEEDDSASEARYVWTDQYLATAQSICAGDQDWFAVPLFEGDTVITDLTFTHAEGDLDVYLYDLDGTTNLTPCCSASAGQSYTDDETLEFTAPTDGTYYVVVEGGYSSEENDYDISILLFSDY